MQTFLPYPDFAESARCLDWRRLGKQRVECKQLLASLGYEITAVGTLARCTPGGWSNHPASKMWRGYEDALGSYYIAVCDEWISRGYRHTMLRLKPGIHVPPPWLGEQKFHDSHKSNLLRKDPVHYGKFGWDVPHDLEYVWPTVPQTAAEASF